MPVITLSLPAAVGILAVVIIAAAAIVYFSTIAAAPPGTFETEETSTPTVTPTVTQPPTATLPATEIPTSTSIPPFDYTVAAGDNSCSQLAFNFGISVQSIIIANNLPSTCQLWGRNSRSFILPHHSARATNTPEPIDATKQACETVPITVQENDTLSSIAANYAVPQEAIKSFNGKTTDNVFIGENLLVPLCMRAATPGPTPTATIPPPYPAPNLLLPADGALTL
jgi:LysM repeat protein